MATNVQRNNAEILTMRNPNNKIIERKRHCYACYALFAAW